MSHYHQNHNYNNNRHNNNNNRHNNKGNTVEIHCKNVPSIVQRKQWYQFVNKQTNNKKWIKNIKCNDEWIIIVKNQEKDEYRNALSGKNISQNKITVYIKGGGGRNNNRYNNRRQSAFNDNDKNFRGNIIIANDQLHLGGVIAQSKLLDHAPASSIADLNKQNKKGNQINSGSSGDISISMNSGNNPNQQNLINAVAKRCGCPIEMSKQALEASNWDPNVAVTKIETFRRSKPPQ
eukprot:511024_1